MSIKEALAVLGLYPGATAPEVKAAYRDRVKLWHPDHYADQPEMREKAEEEIQKIYQAHHVLRDYKYERSALEQEIMSGSWVQSPAEAPKPTPFVATKKDPIVAPKPEAVVAPKQAQSKRRTTLVAGLGGVVAVVAVAAIYFSLRFRLRDERVPHASPAAVATTPAVKDAGVERAIVSTPITKKDPVVPAVAPVHDAVPVKPPVAVAKSPTAPSSDLVKRGVPKQRVAVAPQAPNLAALAGLDKTDRKSLESACSSNADRKSPAAHRACLIRELRAKPRAIHLR